MEPEANLPPRTLIQQYVTGIVKAFVAQAKSIDDLEHNATKGTFRELFVTSILERYLTSQFGIAKGIIVNQRGDQSAETDIIIFDRRILPPFIRENQLCVFPIEAVVGTVSVKTRLTLGNILEAESAAQELHRIANTGTLYSKERRPRFPGTAIIGFYDKGVGILKEREQGREWLETKLKFVQSICLVDDFHWLRKSQWSCRLNDEYAEETKRFIAVLLDNIRTQAERNYRLLTGQLPLDQKEGNQQVHFDWLSIYTRDQPEIARKLHELP